MIWYPGRTRGTRSRPHGIRERTVQIPNPKVEIRKQAEAQAEARRKELADADHRFMMAQFERDKQKAAQEEKQKMQDEQRRERERARLAQIKTEHDQEVLSDLLTDSEVEGAFFSFRATAEEKALVKEIAAVRGIKLDSVLKVHQVLSALRDADFEPGTARRSREAAVPYASGQFDAEGYRDAVLKGVLQAKKDK